LSNRINLKFNTSDTSYLLQKADTSTLSNRINLKFNTSDTSYLLQKADTSTLSNRINLKLNTSDTSYLLQKADTSTLSNRINLKLNTSDTSYLLQKADTSILTSLSNLNTVGTITSGVWSGTAVAIANGGTGLTSVGTTGQVLTTSVSGALSWQTPVSVREVADEFTATLSQTSFILSQEPSVNSKVKMFINGIRISNTAYSIVGTTLTYAPANNGSNTLAVGDRIQFDYFY
jgi:hypothetical protein